MLTVPVFFAFVAVGTYQNVLSSPYVLLLLFFLLSLSSCKKNDGNTGFGRRSLLSRAPRTAVVVVVLVNENSASSCYEPSLGGQSGQLPTCPGGCILVLVLAQDCIHFVLALVLVLLLVLAQDCICLVLVFTLALGLLWVVTG